MIFSVLSEKTRAISGSVLHVTDRPGFKLTTLGSSVRLANHYATAPHCSIVEINETWCQIVRTIGELKLTSG